MRLDRHCHLLMVPQLFGVCVSNVCVCVCILMCVCVRAVCLVRFGLIKFRHKRIPASCAL